jgi:hypothetical protein
MLYMQDILLVLAFLLVCSSLLNPAKEEDMRRDDLMKPDLLSEVVLLGSGIVMVVALVKIVVAAFTRAAALL